MIRPQCRSGGVRQAEERRLSHRRAAPLRFLTTLQPHGPKLFETGRIVNLEVETNVQNRDREKRSCKDCDSAARKTPDDHCAADALEHAGRHGSDRTKKVTQEAPKLLPTLELHACYLPTAWAARLTTHRRSNILLAHLIRVPRAAGSRRNGAAGLRQTSTNADPTSRPEIGMRFSRATGKCRRPRFLSVVGGEEGQRRMLSGAKEWRVRSKRGEPLCVVKQYAYIRIRHSLSSEVFLTSYRDRTGTSNP
ncbi:hypothetical protein BR93DRAFT_221139 [Coniochaeta sp. PMI_546]|nr:hypothetical protein BR93DRAFT_221139 [Coniochaeta sp. PMI_546]